MATKLRVEDYVGYGAPALSADQRLLVVGLYINSALYLTGCFVAGLVLQSPGAWSGALLTAGVSYLAYLAQVARVRRGIAGALVGLSVAFGVVTGLSLLPRLIAVTP